MTLMTENKTIVFENKTILGIQNSKHLKYLQCSIKLLSSSKVPSFLYGATLVETLLELDKLEFVLSSCRCIRKKP